MGEKTGFIPDLASPAQQKVNFISGKLKIREIRFFCRMKFYLTILFTLALLAGFTATQAQPGDQYISYYEIQYAKMKEK